MKRSGTDERSESRGKWSLRNLTMPSKEEESEANELERNGGVWLRCLQGQTKKYYPKRSAGVEIFLGCLYTLASMFLQNKVSD